MNKLEYRANAIFCTKRACGELIALTDDGSESGSGSWSKRDGDEAVWAAVSVEVRALVLVLSPPNHRPGLGAN